MLFYIDYVSLKKYCFHKFLYDSNENKLLLKLIIANKLILLVSLIISKLLHSRL